MTAICATLHSYKSLATRKQLQIVLEVPHEYAADALKMMGLADPSGTQWFALTRLKAGPDAGSHVPALSATVETPRAVNGQDRPRTPFKEKPRSQQAGIMCAEPEFQEWIADGDHGKERKQYITDEDYSAAVLRERLGITSRTELDTTPSKGAEWDKMLTSYQTGVP